MYSGLDSMFVFLVFLQIINPNSSIITVFALMRFFFWMFPHMRFQIAFSIRCKITLITTKWFHAGMNPFVLIEISLIRKRLSTLVAYRRPFAWMCFLVQVQLVECSKGKVALVTFERLSMDKFVLSHIECRCTLIATLCTCISLPTRIRRLVGFCCWLFWILIGAKILNSD